MTRSHLGRLTILAAACGLGFIAFGQGLAAPDAATAYPASLETKALVAWMKQETDLAPASVVAVTPTAVTGILASISSAEGPTRRQVILRSEALSVEGLAKEHGLSWTSVVVVDCKTRQARRGRTLAYAERNLMGEGRETASSTDTWAAPPANGAVHNAMRRVCDGKGTSPLVSETVAAEKADKPAPQASPPTESAKAPAAAKLAATPPPTPRVAKAPEPKPKPGSAPAVPVSKPKPAPAAGAFAQISASSTDAEAKRSLATAQAKVAAPGGVSGRVVKAVVGGKTYHRAQFVGFGSLAEAASFCKALGAKGQACFARGGGE